MALPTVYRESKGISALESLAVGTPLIVPEHGVFPELIADTRGGMLFTPDDSQHLAHQIADAVLDKSATQQMGDAGKQAILDHYQAADMARETLTLYERLLSNTA